MSENTEATEPDDFDEWLATGSVRTKPVVIQINPAAADEITELEKRRKEIARDPASTDRAVGEVDPLAELDAQIDAAYDKYEAGRSVWLVRALTDDEVNEITIAYPIPAPPETPDSKMSDADKEAWLKDVYGPWNDARTAMVEKRALAQIAKAVKSRTTVKGEFGPPTVEQVAKLKATHYGPQYIAQLLSALEETRKTEVELARPKSPGRSTSDSD